jgi:hypothetical protein
LIRASMSDFVRFSELSKINLTRVRRVVLQTRAIARGQGEVPGGET